MAKKKLSGLAIQRAAQAWCTKKTSHKEMDSDAVAYFLSKHSKKA